MITAEKIVKVVSEHTGINAKDIVSRKKKQKIADARHLAIYAITQHLPKYTLEEIGEIFGRNHSTIIHSRNSFSALMDTIPAFKKMYEDVTHCILDRYADSGDGFSGIYAPDSKEIYITINVI